MNVWLFVHVFSLLLAAVSILLIALLWKTGAVADALVKYLGLADPGGAISNKKVLVTLGTLAVMLVFIAGSFKSIALSTEHDIGGNLLWLAGILLGGVATHAGVQSKLNPMLSSDEQDLIRTRRASGAIPQPPGAAQ